MITVKNNFEKTLINHCAPTLSGLKSANMINVDKSKFPNINTFINNFNNNSIILKIKILCECDKKILILLYNPIMLSLELSSNTHIKLLKQFNYSYKSNIDVLLNELSTKIKNNNSFPHEIGLFLGYPIEDIIGFIQYKGDNFKISGYWKVYGDEYRAKVLFTCFNHCKKTLTLQLEQGKNIYEIIKCA